MNHLLTVENLGPCQRPNPIASLYQLNFANDNERLLIDPLRSHLQRALADDKPPDGFELAGPRERIFFDPPASTAAIVTCGGLCPGLNAVIRSVVLQLWYLYGCRHILGIRYGFQGLGRNALSPLKLDPERVNDIQHTGGTILGSSRGTPSAEEIVDTLIDRGIDMLFVIGGDGTMRGGRAIWKEIRQRDLAISVIGIPKTIDNDIPYVHRAFGFETAVEEAVKVIDAAEVEANGAPNGIGLVKLMGRHAGFIAANAALASGNANFCLVPEAPFQMQGEQGLLKRLEQRLQLRHHAVIVVAEGAGQSLFDDIAGEHDASGNLRLQDIGILLKEQINEYFSAQSIEINLKYLDPSYLIRSAPPISSDRLYCDHLARVGVDAAMAGKGGVLIGNWYGCLTHVPMQALEGQSKRIETGGELWFKVCESMGQPQHIGTY